MNRMNFYDSLKNHQIKCENGFALKVTLTKSDNPYFTYPIKGVLYVFEQGTQLRISQGVFHKLHEDGSLGAPAVVGNIEFTYNFNDQI